MIAVLRKIGRVLLSSLGIVTLGVVVVDRVVFQSSKLITPTLTFAKDNDAALSVILSILLFYAYLLQYQSQRKQESVMEREEKLLDAGYTPIVGVSSRTWWDKHEDNGGPAHDVDAPVANRLILDLQNQGNSTARDLQIWFGISYQDCENLEAVYAPTAVPLLRKSETSWWRTGLGGALAPESETSTTFQADAEVRKIKKRRLLGVRRLFPFIDIPSETVEIHEALEDLRDNGVETVSVATTLQYRNAAGSEKHIDLGAYEITLEKLGKKDMRMSEAMESRTDDVSRVRECAFNY